MSAAVHAPPPRPVVDGKFFRVDGKKFFIKGVSYGPFAPNRAGEHFPELSQVTRDLRQMVELGANTLRVYDVPPRWFLDAAAAYNLKLFIDIPWEKHRCFLESYEMREAARECVRAAVKRCAGHSAVFAYSIANEVPTEIVRWHGAANVAQFIDELIGEAREADPGCLCTFSSFPPTEFLHPEKIDFVTFNVYLHAQPALESYLARLQTIAGEKPLVLGEFGIDSLREGEKAKCEVLRWQIETACRAGLAGAVAFSFTDDWFRGGRVIDDWQFGLTTADRKPKPSFAVVQEMFQHAPCLPLPRTPRVSVVVASYNGAATLTACLQSLTQLNYPDYEIVLIDDGSTDNTPEIVARFPAVHYFRQSNMGLSAARNAGIIVATGEIVAFTDSDCRVDDDWLYYIVSDLLRFDGVAIGGHNFLPPDDSPVAAAVLVSPGGPAHVMLTDREAEHIPGCNMAFYKWALTEIGGFDPVFRKAGDDVDVCWRLQARGYRIGFSPAGFVWHYRRSTVRAYLRQQAGYGEAEALLAQKHPEYFNAMGGSIWRGRIYTAAQHGVVLQRPVIYHGALGSGFFQRLYTRDPALPLMFCTSLPFYLFVTVPLLLLGTWLESALTLAAASFLFSSGVCCAAAVQANVPSDRRRLWSRPLVALLFFLQPVVRGWARYQGRINPQFQVGAAEQFAELSRPWREVPTLGFWSRRGVDRLRLLHEVQRIVSSGGLQHKWDSGWDDYDLEVVSSRWNTVRAITTSEELAGGKRFLRCRIDARWSWLSWIAVIFSFVLVIGLCWYGGADFPWIWMSLTILPIIVFLIDCEKQSQRLLLAGIVNEAAIELDLEPFSAMDSNKESKGEDVACAPAAT